jgi:hypothetical protein
MLIMKRILCVGLLALLAAGASWAQFYDGLGAAERRDLAEAYYLVGQRYAQQGEPAKGREFEGMAFHIDPGLDPAALEVAGPETGPARPEYGAAPKRESPEVSEAMVALLRSRFLRLVSAFLTEDLPTLLSMMDGSLWFSRFDRELGQEAIAADLSNFFARADLSGGLAPSAVFDLASLEVLQVKGAPGWGPSYAVRIRARADFSEEVAFWEQEQQYLYHPRDRQWLLFAVGSGMPPASWNPQAPVAAPTMSAAAAVGDLRAIREAFLASLGHFLARQTGEASNYFTREILIVRLNATLTREEMAATFEGYFEGGDFSGVSAEEVVDTGSISVEPSERFAGERPGPLYRLSVRTRLDLSESIPFWTRFQEYYFSAEEGGWRIFAIF